MVNGTDSHYLLIFLWVMKVIYASSITFFYEKFVLCVNMPIREGKRRVWPIHI